MSIPASVNYGARCSSPARRRRRSARPTCWDPWGRAIYAGRTVNGLAAFDRAVQLSTGALMGRVLHRRGIMLWNLGQYPAALDDFRRAISVLQRAGDPVWTARALSGRGLVYLATGAPPGRMLILWLPGGCSREPASRWKRSRR